MPNFLIPSKLGLGALGALFMVAFAPNAFAQEECGDTTCDVGYECMSFQSSCLVIACPEGDDCDFECDSSEQFYCQRAECSDDSECGDHMVCATHERYNCPETDFACDPDGPCEEPEKVECTPEEYSECTPRHELPCEEASDCGEGFNCETLQFCSCPGSEGSVGGSAAAPPADELPPPDEGDGDTGGEEDDSTEGGEDAEAERLAPAEPEGRPAPEECKCEDSDENHCVVVEQACEEDADCLDDWTCADNGGGACWQDSEGNSGCDEPDPARVCMPPGQNLIGIAEAGIATSGEADTAASSGAAEGEDGRDPGGELPVADELDDNDGNGGKELTEPGDPDDIDAEPTALPQEDSKDVDDAIEDQADDDAEVAELDEDDATTETNGVDLDSSGDNKSSGGGCSVSSTGAGGDGLTMLLIALGAALSRRRRKTA